MKQWPLQPLGEVCVINPKLAPSEMPALDDDVTFVPMAAVDEMTGTIAEPLNRRYQEVAKGYTSFSENDVLFAKITPCMENGKAAIARSLNGGHGFGSTEFHVLRPTDKILPEWIFAFVRQPAFREVAKANFTGTAGQKRVPVDFLKKFPIPVPPLPEQERIVKLLDEADELRKLRTQADRRTDALIPALFHEMFGDSEANSKGWPSQPLGMIVDCLDSQRVPVTENVRKPGDIPYYGANGQVGWIDKYLFDEPLLLIAEDGGYFDQPERGVAYSIMGKSWVNNHAHVLRPRVGVAELCYLEALYRHFDFRPFVSGTTRAKLNKKQLLSISTIVPPLALQKEFAAHMAEIRALEAEQAASCRRLDALFQSVLHCAFNGEL